MIPPFVSHQQFVRVAFSRARSYGCLRSDHRHFDVWQKLRKTNLDGAHPLLSIAYSDKQGRPARNPVCMLRSCLAMMECDVADFDTNKDIVNRLADRILARDFPLTPLAAILEGYGDFSALPVSEQVLQPIFYTCFVARSVELKLIDLDDLYVAGDGSKLPTWANPRGKKLCDCDNRGKKLRDRCRCYRAYRDPLALWGWDSYRECWVYGHSFYEKSFQTSALYPNGWPGC